MSCVTGHPHTTSYFVPTLCTCASTELVALRRSTSSAPGHTLQRIKTSSAPGHTLQRSRAHPSVITVPFKRHRLRCLRAWYHDATIGSALGALDNDMLARPDLGSADKHGRLGLGSNGSAPAPAALAPAAPRAPRAAPAALPPGADPLAGLGAMMGGLMPMLEGEWSCIIQVLVDTRALLFI